MAEKSLHNSTVSSTGGGLHTESSPVDQPKNTYRFALNAVNISTDGKKKKLSNELGNLPSGAIPEGFIILGDEYIEDGTSAVILLNPLIGRQEIGLINKDHQYVSYVNTSLLGLLESNQCDIIYRLRRGKERVIYWVDAHNLARTFNFDKVQDYYNEVYRAYLRAGNDPNTFLGEKWDKSSFDLIKTFSEIPFFSNIQVLEIGSILPGSYNFAIQLVDEDLNPTEWINVSSVVNIFNDSANNTFARIRGSKNVDNTAQSFPRASKSIKLTISNLDTAFPYYRVAIIRAAGVNGVPDKVLISDIVPTSDSNFTYSGNDANLTEGSLEEILIENEVIYAPHHIEQIENRCQLANTKGKGINWCDFQKYASKISADLATKEVILNNLLSEPNIKNAKSSFFYGGHMPGEVYAYNVNYVFNDGYISPGFHIPGRSLANVGNSSMGYYAAQYEYLDIHNCSTDNFWGKDSEGNTLVGKAVRHHKFPFRKEVNKPLYTRSTTPTTISKHRLSVVVTMNPDYESDPPGDVIAFPEDGNGDPLVIPYTFTYKTTSSPDNIDINGQLTDTDIGVPIIIYDDIDSLDELDTPNYALLTGTLSDYQADVGNERFIITETYTEYEIDSSTDSDISEIFGINFSNIERPHPDVIGFYITRAERTDDDRTILDNAIFGIMTEYEQFVSFGHLMPKRFYEAENCYPVPFNSGKTLQFHDKGVWFFSPEHQFLGKKDEFDSVVVEGKYSETVVNMPTISNIAGSECNHGHTKGVYVDDVQAGTSYNGEVNKKKDQDDDGFDLLVGYRNTEVEYAIDNITVFPDKKRIYHMNATSYQNLDDKIYYNVSVDNKIGMLLSDDIFDVEAFNNSTTKENTLIYGSLVRNNNNLYSNFQTRNYFKIHNNPVLFNGANSISNVELYGGDANISPMTLVSSLFYDMVVGDRAKKSKVWKIAVGAVLIVAGVLVGIFTAGAGLTISAIGISTLVGLAVSYGVSLAIAGIKFEQFKSMVETDYEKGLKETVMDGGVYETVRDSLAGKDNDDTIRWFADRLNNVYIESAVPVGLRAGLTAGVSDFVDSPYPYDEASFRTYLIEKLTVLDRDQGSGRLYKGYAGAEFYDVNPDYMRFNKQKLFTPLAIEYDCCTDSNEVFPMRLWASEQSFQEEKTDNYRTFLPNNYIDVEGEHGEITDLYRMGNNLFIHTREALYMLPQNQQERVTNEIVSFIGTGGFFAVPPKKVIDSALGSAGTQHKWATLKTHVGVFFINETEHTIYLHSDKPKDISSEDNFSWFQENLKANLSDQLYTRFGIRYARANNPASKSGIGYISNLDTRYKRVVFTKRDYAIIDSKLEELRITNLIPTTGVDFAFSTLDNNFYSGITKLSFDNANFFINKSWTISLSLIDGKFVGWHSFIPNYYIHSQGTFYSAIANSSSIWRHNIPGLFQTYYGVHYPFIVEHVNTNQINTESSEYIIVQTEARKLVNGQYLDQKDVTFNKILIYNTNQSSGVRNMIAKQNEANMANFMFNQITNRRNAFLISRRAKEWSINNLRDYVVNKDVSLFLDDWDTLKNNYYIDKVVNPASVNSDKAWHQLATFQDKFMVVRLIFDNFSDINLTLNFTIETEQDSTL